MVVALIRSNQWEQAKKEVEKIGKSAKGLAAFFLLKDKKYDEALQ